jgi:hypothetical protein
MLRRSLHFAPFALAVLGFLLAAPADAHGRKWRRHFKHHHGHHHRHHHGCGHSYGPGYGHGYHHGGYPVYHYAEPSFYYCGPCGHHFRSYDALSHHVHHHHHVSLLELPFLIVHGTLDATLGWIFHGHH